MKSLISIRNGLSQVASARNRRGVEFACEEQKHPLHRALFRPIPKQRFLLEGTDLLRLHFPERRRSNKSKFLQLHASSVPTELYADQCTEEEELDFESCLLQEGDEEVEHKARTMNGRQVNAQVKQWLRVGKRDKACSLLRAKLCLEPDNVFLLTTLAREQARQGRVQEARACFQRAHECGPPQGCAINLQAWACLESQCGDILRARRLFKQAVEVKPTHAPAWQAWALMEFQKAGNTDRARELFQLAHRADGRHLPTMQAWAAFEGWEENYEKATELFEMAIETDPKHVPSHQAYAEMEWRRGNRDFARKLFRNAEAAASPNSGSKNANKQSSNISTNSRSSSRRSSSSDKSETGEGRKRTHKVGSELKSSERAEDEVGRVWQDGGRRRQQQQARSGGGNSLQLSAVLTAWGAAEARLGEANTGLHLLRRATQACVYNAQAWLLLARHLSFMDKGTQAERVLMKGLRYVPGNQQLRHARAMVLLSLGSRELARQELSLMLEQDPRSAHAAHTLGSMAMQEGEVEEALQYYNQGATQGRQGSAKAKCHGALGLHMAMLRNIDEARRHYKAGALALESGGHAAGLGRASHLRHWALFEKKHGTTASTRELFEESTRANPDDYRTWLQWGTWERGRKNEAQAKECFERGIIAAPKNPFCYQFLALLEAAAGNTDEARAAFAVATSTCSGVPALWMEWALFEMRDGDIDRARELFQTGAEIKPYHVPLFESWSLMEAREGHKLKAEAIIARIAESSDINVDASAWTG